jgi:hypothetical protein
MTVAYLYKWTNKLSGKWYIGSRTRKDCHPNDGYICSSKLVRPMIIEDRSNWKRTILVIGNPQYIRELESKLLTSLNAADSNMSFNQHNGAGKFSTTGIAPCNKGKTGLQVAWNKGLPKEKQPFFGKSISHEVREKLSIRKQGENNPMYGKPAWNKGLTGITHSEESNKKRSESLKGKSRSPETIAKIKRTKAVNKAAKLNTAVEIPTYNKTESLYYTGNLQ